MDKRLLLSPEEAFGLLGVGRATFFKMLSSGEIPSLKIGRLRRIPAEALRGWVERQVAMQCTTTEKESNHGDNG
jgi:excisionase family DNA binding protein